MEAVDRPICILRSHFVTEVHRMQILPHMRHILPADWPCKTISIIKKETRFSTRFTINLIYRLSPVRKGREEDIVLYINVHREISAFFTIMDHFSNAFDANISNLHHWLRFEKIPFLYSSWYVNIMTSFDLIRNFRNF